MPYNFGINSDWYLPASFSIYISGNLHDPVLIPSVLSNNKTAYAIKDKLCFEGLTSANIYMR